MNHGFSLWHSISLMTNDVENLHVFLCRASIQIFLLFFFFFFWNWTVFVVSIIISRSQRKKVARYSDKKIKRMKEREVKAAGNTCL